MNKSIINSFIYIFILICISFALSLNFFNIKSPNDGAYYFGIAKSFLENQVLVDPFYDPPKTIPSTQFGISILLFIFLSISEKYWFIPYLFFVSIIWFYCFLEISKLSIEISKKQNIYNENNAIIISVSFFLLLFLNIDGLLTSSSFYNEAVYYPTLIIFLSIMMRKLLIFDKYIFRLNLESVFIFLFLILGFIFRIQHVTIFPALFIFALINKKKTDIILLLIILFFISLYFFIMSNVILSDQSELNLNRAKTTIDLFYSPIEILLPVLKELYLNWYNFFGVFSSPFNLSRILDFKLSYHLDHLWFLIIYIILSALIIYLFYKGLREIKKFNLYIYIFSITIVISNILFILSLPDQDTRYFLNTNFIIIFILLFYLKEYFNVYRLQKNFLKIVIIFLIFSITLPIYAYEFFYNKKKTVSSQIIVKTLQKFKEKYNVKDYAIYTVYPREILWVLNSNTISVTPKQYLEINPNLNHKKFIFIGYENQFYSNNFIITSKEKISTNYQLGKKIIFSDDDNTKFSIWLIETIN